MYLFICLGQGVEGGMFQHTWHLSKHVSQPPDSFPVKLDPRWKEGGALNEEIISHSIGWRRNKDTQILQQAEIVRFCVD